MVYNSNIWNPPKFSWGNNKLYSHSGILGNNENKWITAMRNNINESQKHY